MAEVMQILVFQLDYESSAIGPVNICRFHLQLQHQCVLNEMRDDVYSYEEAPNIIEVQRCSEGSMA